MSMLINHFPTLLAAGGHFQDLGRRFRAGEGPNIFSVLMLLACAVLAVWVFSRIYMRIKLYLKNSPGSLFRELCREHKISWSERRLLRDLADWQHLEYKAQVFLEPERFDAALLSPGLAEHRKILEELRDKIFGRKPS